MPQSFMIGDYDVTVRINIETQFQCLIRMGFEIGLSVTPAMGATIRLFLS